MSVPEEIHKPSVLITGDAGYIGSALTQELSDYYNLIGYDLVHGNDILDLSRLRIVMNNVKPKLVIHLAALSNVTECNQDPQKAFSVNVLGTRNVLTVMKECGCDNIIFASTSSVYGNSKDLPYTEENICRTKSMYGITKLLAEILIAHHYMNNPGNYVILRLFNVVGTSGHSVIDKKFNPGYDRIFSSLESGHVTIYGDNYDTIDGTPMRDYVSLKDVCYAFINASILVLNFPLFKEVINICTCTPTSVLDLITLWNDVGLPNVTYNIGTSRSGDPAIVYGSNKKAEILLVWRPIKSINILLQEFKEDRYDR